MLESIKTYPNLKITCLTARKYGKSWSKYNVMTFETFFNPMSLIGKILRFLLRTNLVKQRFKKIRYLILKKSILRSIFLVPHNLRHYMALDLVKTLAPEDFIFLVDSRDLIFQVSPIELSKMLSNTGKLNLFDEGGLHYRDHMLQNFQESEANRSWVYKLLNRPPEFNLENVIINGGCIAGSAKEVKKLLEITTSLIAQSNFGVEELLDQAALNVAVYSGLITENSIQINKNGVIVLNMCGIPENTFTLSEGLIYCDGNLVPIIHQFDRFGYYSPGKGITLSRRDYKIAE